MDDESDVEWPEFLYQYRTLEGSGLAYLEQLLLRNELYLGSPARFNDPFDAKVNIDFSHLTVQDWRRFYMGGLKASLSYPKREKEVTRIMKTGHHKDAAKLNAIVSDLQAEVDRLGITCFSEIPTSILMWSHYAASHTGICIQFDHMNPNSLVATAQRVGYSDNYEPLRAFLDNEDRQVELVLLTKASSWSYEREWRIIDIEQGVGIRELPSSAVRGIILGCRMEAPMRESVLSIAAKRPRRVEILQARRSSTKFVLDFEKVIEAV